MLPSILIVSNLFPPDMAGGAELVAARQAKALAEQGCRVEIFAGHRPKSPEETGVLTAGLWNGLRTFRLGLRSLAADDNFAWSVAATYFEGVLSRGRFDIVHFHNIAGLGVGLIEQARAHGCRTVVTIHDHWGFCFRSTRLRDDNSVCDTFEACHVCQPLINFENRPALPMRLRRDYVFRALDKADHLVFPSQYLAGAYAASGFAASHMAVISNGIDTDRFSQRKSASERVRFLSLGYLGEHKGILVLLEALRILADDHGLDGRWSFRLGGEGHLRDYVERQIASTRLRGKLEYMGRVDQEAVPQLFEDTDVFVMASIWPENEPVTLLECASSGTAQLASNIGGNVDLVIDGVTGGLFAPGDPSALAASMRRYVLDPDLARTQGRSNWQRRDKLNERRTIQALISVYTTAVVSNEPIADAPTVVCVGAQPMPYVREILESWSQIAHGTPTVRFVSDAWPPADAIFTTTAIWFWDPSPPTEQLLHALRSGRPIIAPRWDARLEALRGLGAPVFVYKDGLEALSLLKTATVTRARFDAAVAADLLTGTAPYASFTTPTLVRP